MGPSQSQLPRAEMTGSARAQSKGACRRVANGKRGRKGYLIGAVHVHVDGGEESSLSRMRVDPSNHYEVF
jgi:hypothetical protein